MQTDNLICLKDQSTELNKNFCLIHFLNIDPIVVFKHLCSMIKGMNCSKERVVRNVHLKNIFNFLFVNELLL